MPVSSPVSSQSAVVLIIDPEPDNQRAMRDRLIRLGYTVRSTDDYESATAILEATPPDVVMITGMVGSPEVLTQSSPSSTGGVFRL